MGGARGGVEGIPAADVPEASDLPKFCELMVKQTGFFFYFPSYAMLPLLFILSHRRPGWLKTNWKIFTVG